MAKPTGIFVLCLIAACRLAAQSAADGGAERIMTESTVIGVGASQVKDTYLSPFNYTGWGGRILNERMTALRSGKAFRQQIINVNISSTKNPAENVNDFGAFADYSLGYRYRAFSAGSVAVLPGAFAHLMGGFIYNTRNGNNPLSAKVDIDLGLSVMLLYVWQVNNRPLTFRYQGDLPLGGLFFAPPYGISYYEMFNEGNTADIIAFNSFHNKFAMKNYVFVDFPVRSVALRVGYLNSLYHTAAKEIDTHILSHTFLIGWVKKFAVK
jgi:hypothetical protein